MSKKHSHAPPSMPPGPTHEIRCISSIPKMRAFPKIASDTGPPGHATNGYLAKAGGNSNSTVKFPIHARSFTWATDHQHQKNSGPHTPRSEGGEPRRRNRMQPGPMFTIRRIHPFLELKTDQGRVGLNSGRNLPLRTVRVIAQVDISKRTN